MELALEVHSHSIWIHGLAREELVVLEVANDLLRVSLGVLLELGDGLVASTVLLEALLDLLHVALEMGEIALLVERGGVEAEGVDDVDNGLLCVVDFLAALLSRGVTADVEVLATDRDLLAVGLVDSAVNLLEVVRVGDDLVAGDEVLCAWCGQWGEAWRRGRGGISPGTMLKGRKKSVLGHRIPEKLTLTMRSRGSLARDNVVARYRYLL